MFCAIFGAVAGAEPHLELAEARAHVPPVGDVRLGRAVVFATSKAHEPEHSDWVGRVAWLVVAWWDGGLLGGGAIDSSPLE